MLEILREKFKSEQHIIRKIKKLKKGASRKGLLLLSIAPLAACSDDGSGPALAPPPPPPPAPDPTFTQDPTNVWTAIDDTNSTLDESGSTENLVVLGKAGDDVISTGSGNDIIRSGQGADTIDGGAGDDIFVIVGTTGTDEYVLADIDGTGGVLDLTSVVSLSTLNDQAISEAATGEVIDGGTGNNTLVIFGDVDLTDFTLTNVTNLVINSTLSLTQDQLAQFTTINGDGSSVVNIVIPEGSTAVLDLSAVDVSNIASINIDGDVTIQVSNTTDFSGIGAITVSAGSTLSLEIMDDGSESTINLQEVADVFVTVDTIVVEASAELVIDDATAVESLGLTDISGEGEVVVDATVDQEILPLDPTVTITTKGTILKFGTLAEEQDGITGIGDHLADKTEAFQPQLNQLDYALDTDSWESNGELLSIGSSEIVISHTVFHTVEFEAILSNGTLIDLAGNVIASQSSDGTLTPIDGISLSLLDDGGIYLVEDNRDSIDYLITFSGNFSSTATTVTELFSDLGLDGSFTGTFDGLTIDANGVRLLDGTWTDNQLSLSIPGAEAGQSLDFTITGDFLRSVEVVRDIISGTDAHLEQDFSISAVEITVNGEVVGSLSYDEHNLTIQLGDYLLVAEGDFLISKNQVLSMVSLDSIVNGDLTGLDVAVTSVIVTRTVDANGDPLVGDAGLILQLDVNGLDPIDLGSVISKLDTGEWVTDITQATLDSSLLSGYDVLDFSALTNPVFTSLDANMSIYNLKEIFLPHNEFGEIQNPVNGFTGAIDVSDGDASFIYLDSSTGSLHVIEGNTANDLSYSVEEIHGGQGDDILHGSITDNIITGNDGDDILIGSYGNDTINGGSGNDILFGDDVYVDVVSENGFEYTIGNVTIDPVAGILTPITADELAYGVNGQDTFVFDTNWGQDTVADFELNNDILDLSSTGLTFSDLQISTLLASELNPDIGHTAEDDAAIGSLGTEITTAGGDSIFLLGVNLADLTEAQFDFGT